MRKALPTTQRLFVDSALRGGQQIVLNPKQSHYLLRVLRFKLSAPLRLFNGRDGEYKATFVQEAKKLALLDVQEQIRPQETEKDLWLYAAPLKPAHFDFLVMKATELGVTGIQPILTMRTQIRDLRLDRLAAIATEAAEQSDRLTVPAIQEPIKLEKIIKPWDEKRLPLICAEHGEATSIHEGLQKPSVRQASGTAIFTGPEGGFLPEELESLAHLKNAVMLRLGPRILRADTAAISALACWQSECGEWVPPV